jgi:hypothetical protein
LAATVLTALAPLVVGLLVQHVSGAWALGAFAAAMAVAAALRTDRRLYIPPGQNHRV